MRTTDSGEVRSPRRSDGRSLEPAGVLHALHRMKSSGMTHATVANTGTNEASRALYAACGFTSWHRIDDYVKPIPAWSD